jgi:hypothetical protein
VKEKKKGLVSATPCQRWPSQAGCGTYLQPTSKKLDVLPIFIGEVVIMKVLVVGGNKMLDGILVHNSAFFKKRY